MTEDMRNIWEEEPEKRPAEGADGSAPFSVPDMSSEEEGVEKSAAPEKTDVTPAHEPNPLHEQQPAHEQPRRYNAAYPPRTGAYSAYYNRPDTGGYTPPSYGASSQRDASAWQPPAYRPAPSYEQARPHEYTQSASAYAPPAYGGAAPQKPKKKRRTGLIVLCCILGALLLFGGGFAGMMAYNIYYGTPNAEGGPSDPAGGAQNAENERPRGDATLEITPTPEDTPSAGGASGGQELTVEQIAEKVTPSVVGIVAESDTSLTQGSSGSGIIMSEDGYIITNYHVIEGSDRITVVLDNGDDYAASVVGVDEKTDIAVLKIEGSGLPAAEFGDSDALKKGSLAVAIGNPMGIQLQGTVTQGCISAINRDVSVENRTMTLIQTDAAINPGNSGGPLVNKYGQVVGINSVKLGISYYEGLGFAIPINTVKPIVDELIAYGYIKGRPAIGITGYNLNERAANYYGVPQGILVDSVQAGSDAEAKGIKAGDIITAANGRRITTMSELTEIRDDYVAGDTLTLTVYRAKAGSVSGENIDISIVLMDEALISAS